ncbi:MAG: hypothetical protein JNK60_18540 [Acidobacteria bacterium]|nr:hypothetical protein [Acidobacteriota bacterium]
MLERIRRDWKEFKDDTPGKRFVNRFEKTERTPGARGWRIGIMTVGLLVMAAGIVLMPLPGPGILIVALGAGMLSQGSKRMARGLDWLEVKARKLAVKTKRAWNAAPMPIKGAVALVAAIAVTGFGYLTYRMAFAT